MSAGPFVDPDTGALYLSVDAWAVLVRAATAQESEPPASETAAATDLAEAGILVDGEVDPRIAPHLRAVTRATAVMALAGSDSRVAGWLGADGVTIARPHDASTLEVVWAPIPLLLEVLTRLTGLGPRPRGAVAPVRTTAGELAAVVARMDSPTPTRGRPARVSESSTTTGRWTSPQAVTPAWSGAWRCSTARSASGW